MEFRRLKLTGFKSFVEPAELRIEPGLTGIVGPNGCGKSNLLEAIRWVMGESSARSMRGGGMEDVIFAGTTQRPRARLCRSDADGDDRSFRSVRRRTGSGAPHRTRRGQRLSRQRQGRARQGRGAGLRRCRHRRAQPGAGQPGPHRGGDRRAPRRTAHDAGGSGGDRRPARPPARCGTEAARHRNQSRTAGGPAGGAGRPDRHAAPAGTRRRTLQGGKRTHPRSRGAHGLCPLARRGGRGRRGAAGSEGQRGSGRQRAGRRARGPAGATCRCHRAGRSARRTVRSPAGCFGTRPAHGRTDHPAGGGRTTAGRP